MYCCLCPPEAVYFCFLYCRHKRKQKVEQKVQIAPARTQRAIQTKQRVKPFHSLSKNVAFTYILTLKRLLDNCMQIPLYRTECLISRFIGKYTDRANHSGRNKYIYLHSNVENTLSELPFPRSESLELPKYRRHILDLGSSGGILIISREVRD